MSDIVVAVLVGAFAGWLVTLLWSFRFMRQCALCRGRGSIRLGSVGQIEQVCALCKGTGSRPRR